MGLTEGVQRAYLATLAREERRATGFGLYHMVGLGILPASLIAGCYGIILVLPRLFGLVRAWLD